MNTSTRLLAAALLALCAGACQSSPAASSAGSSAASLPWTGEFQQKSILIADEVSIEGPPGLIEHVAYKQAPDQKYSPRTTSEGFMQEVTADESSTIPVRIYVDNLTIDVLHRGRWLERVTQGPVRISARGDAYWKNLETGQEQRAATIELIGHPGK